jgi:hypothetical protein
MAGVKKSTACVTIRRVAKALVAKSALLISMPTRSIAIAIALIQCLLEPFSRL